MVKWLTEQMLASQEGRSSLVLRYVINQFGLNQSQVYSLEIHFTMTELAKALSLLVRPSV
jgi:hypothetical protein